MPFSRKHQSFVYLSFSLRQLLQIQIRFHFRCDKSFPRGVAPAFFSFLFTGHSSLKIFMNGSLLSQSEPLRPAVLFFLVPPPLVHLRLRQPSEIGHLDYFILGPAGLHLQLPPQHLDLRRALPPALPDAALFRGLLVDLLQKIALRLAPAALDGLPLLAANFILDDFLLFSGSCELGGQKLREEIAICRQGRREQFQTGGLAMRGKRQPLWERRKLPEMAFFEIETGVVPLLRSNWTEHGCLLN